jgi:hypothetical protein
MRVVQKTGFIKRRIFEMSLDKRAGVSTAAAELLSRLRAKVDDLCRERQALRDASRLKDC